MLDRSPLDGFTRRAFLTFGSTFVTGVVAGCLEDDGLDDTDTETPTESPPTGTSTPSGTTSTPTPSPTPSPTPIEPSVAVEPGEQSDEISLYWSVEPVQPLLGDPDSPVVLEITVTNMADEVVTYTRREDAFFIGVQADSFILESAETFADYEFDDAAGQWYATDERFTQPALEAHQLEAGESASVEVLLLAGYNVPLPAKWPETLTFGSEYNAEVGAYDDPLDVTSVHQWSFTLVLND